MKKNPEIQKRFWKKVEDFIENPFDKKLKTHKLSGKLQNVWSFSLSRDLRVLFYFVENDKVIFFDIGKHDEVY